MRKVLLITAALVALVSIGGAAPGGAQTTTIPPNPGQTGDLVITGVAVCTATVDYEVTWTLQNNSEVGIGFLQAYAALNANFSDPDRVDLTLDPIDGGSSSTVVTTTAGSTRGQYVLQTEAFFEGEEPYAGPVPGVVALDGSCGQPASTSTAAAAEQTAPSYTG